MTPPGRGWDQGVDRAVTWGGGLKREGEGIVETEHRRVPDPAVGIICLWPHYPLLALESHHGLIGRWINAS